MIDKDEEKYNAFSKEFNNSLIQQNKTKEIFLYPFEDPACILIFFTRSNTVKRNHLDIISKHNYKIVCIDIDKNEHNRINITLSK